MIQSGRNMLCFPTFLACMRRILARGALSLRLNPKSTKLSKTLFAYVKTNKPLSRFKRALGRVCVAFNLMLHCVALCELTLQE